MKPETPRSPGYHLVELRFERSLSWWSYAELDALEEKAKAANLGHEQEKALLGDGFKELKLQKVTEEVRANPNSASSYYTRGMEYSNQGKNDEAVADITKATELEPANDTYRTALEKKKKEIAEEAAAAKKGFIVLIAVVVIIGLIIHACSHAKAADEYARASFHSTNFILVKALRTFEMGSNYEDDERPVHEVVLEKPFYISKYEVTQAEYTALMGTNPSLSKKGSSLPVEGVSWYDAIEYCNARSEKEGLQAAYIISKDKSDPNNTNEDDTIKWTVTWDKESNGYRLPTEAEWEYACKSGTTSQYGLIVRDKYIRERPKKYFHFDAKRTVSVWEIGTNNWGLESMLGNVWEWCWDWEGPYSSGAQIDPAGPSSGESRETRGGGWDSEFAYIRAANRGRENPAVKRPNLGFRLVRYAE
jgi:formylglycine-generating enzyme required for sulfatase activity